MICSICSANTIEVRWDDVPNRLLYCSVCDKFFLSEGDEYIHINEESQFDVELPLYDIGTPVYITNRDHEFFLEAGYVSKKDHKHYRIKFVSKNDKIDGKQVWVPDHWVRDVPKFLRG